MWQSRKTMLQNILETTSHDLPSEVARRVKTSRRAQVLESGKKENPCIESRIRVRFSRNESGKSPRPRGNKKEDAQVGNNWRLASASTIGSSTIATAARRPDCATRQGAAAIQHEIEFSTKKEIARKPRVGTNASTSGDKTREQRAERIRSDTGDL